MYDALWRLSARYTYTMIFWSKITLIDCQKEVNGEQLLDFSVEEPWTCLPMPSRALWNTGPGLDIDEKLLTQPKPDLAVCFRRKAVIKDSLWRSLPEATKELACFENQNSGNSRIFHFFSGGGEERCHLTRRPESLASISQ